MQPYLWYKRQKEKFARNWMSNQYEDLPKG